MVSVVCRTFFHDFRIPTRRQKGIDHGFCESHANRGLSYVLLWRFLKQTKYCEVYMRG